MSLPYKIATACVFLLLLLVWYASYAGWGLPSTARTAVWSVRTGSVGYYHSYGGYSHYHSFSGGGSHGGK